MVFNCVLDKRWLHLPGGYILIFEYESFVCWNIFWRQHFKQYFKYKPNYDSRTICYSEYTNILWYYWSWNPIPDTRYKSQDGRDLNLEVICTTMVSDHPDITTLGSLNYPFCIWSDLFVFARLNTGNTIHLIWIMRIYQYSRPLTISMKRNIYGEMLTKARYIS